MEECKKALSEVNVIINNIPEELRAKISSKLKNTIELERDKGYNPDINELVVENNMLPETVIILGMIYRDFLCSETEKENLKNREKEIAKEKYKECENKYSYENLFKGRKNNETEKIENKEIALIEIKEKWYEKVLKFFRTILRK